MTGATTSIAFPPKQFIDDGPDYAEDDPAFSEPEQLLSDSERSGGRMLDSERSERSEFNTGGRGESENKGIGRELLGDLMYLSRLVRFDMRMAPVDIKPFVSDWHQKSKYRAVDFLLIWHEFKIAMGKARYPVGAKVVKNAADYPLPLPNIAESYPPDFQQVMSLCHTLAMANGKREFFLASREPWRRFKIPQSKSYRIMRILVADKILKCTDKGQRGKKGRAARYVWIGPEE